jgi:hypothetical protein
MRTTSDYQIPYEGKSRKLISLSTICETAVKIGPSFVTGITSAAEPMCERTAQNGNEHPMVMPSKTRVRVDSRSVREKVQKSKGKPSHIGKPSRAMGRRAERIAAKEQGVSGEIKRASSRGNKKTVSRSDAKPKVTKARKKSAIS